MTEENQAAQPRRAGAQRSQRAHDATIQAVLSLLWTQGYHGMTIEGIAAEAGVGKATIYRWWKSKAEVVLDALISVAPHLPAATTMSGLDEFRMLGTQGSRQRLQMDGTAMTALLSDLYYSSPDLIEKMRTEWLLPAQQGMRNALERAIREGDLPPDVDVDLILDVLAGTTIFRSMMNRSGYDPGVVHQVIDAMVATPPLRNGSDSAAKEVLTAGS